MQMQTHVKIHIHMPLQNQNASWKSHGTEAGLIWPDTCMLHIHVHSKYTAPLSTYTYTPYFRSLTFRFTITRLDWHGMIKRCRSIDINWIVAVKMDTQVWCCSLDVRYSVPQRIRMKAGKEPGREGAVVRWKPCIHPHLTIINSEHQT